MVLINFLNGAFNYKNKLFKSKIFFACLIIFLITFFYLFWKYQSRLIDTAIFGGDEWEYQSLGVNLAFGHGYQEGRLEEFPAYKFNTSENLFLYHDPLTGAHLTYKDYFNQGGVYSFYRTPGYPVFLALIYKIFGVHPLYVKITQIFLLAVCAAFLPLIGQLLWGAVGFGSGIVSAVLFVLFYSPAPAQIMTEPLIVFVLFVWALLFIYWEKQASFFRTFLLGIFSAVIVLVKGLNIFIPIFFLIYLFFKFRNTPRALGIKTLVFITGFVLLMLPWIFYATLKSGRLILLSVHSETLLLDSNNENSIYDGDWHPQWRKNIRHEKNYFYYRLKDSGYSPGKKVFLFLWGNKKYLPQLLFNKFRRAFILKPDILVILLLMLAYYGCRLRGKVKKITAAEIFPLIYLGNIFLITMIFYGRYLFVLPFLPFFLLPSVYLPFFLFRK